MEIIIEPQDSPIEWVHRILTEAKNRSQGEVVAQHLIGAQLKKRYPEVQVPDLQTEHSHSFIIGNTIYHVRVKPDPGVIKHCAENIKSGLHPVLLTSSEFVSKARYFAEYIGLEKQLSVLAIEDFVALNIIEMATGNQTKFLEVLREIISIYNERLEEVETDMSLKIEVQ